MVLPPSRTRISPSAKISLVTTFTSPSTLPTRPSRVSLQASRSPSLPFLAMRYSETIRLAPDWTSAGGEEGEQSSARERSCREE